MNSNMKNRMTMNQLAKELKISRTTLYNIMHQKGSFSEETKERVFRALEEYDFRANNNARNLAKHREYRIAFVGFYSQRFKYFFDEIDLGIKRAIADYEDDGLQIIRKYSDREEPQQQIEDLKELDRQGIESFIIFCYHYEYVFPQIKELIEKGKNVILFSRRIPDSQPMCSVGCNDYLSGKLMMELLQKFAPAGSRVQLLISEHNHHDKLVVGERLAGFYDALAKSKKRFRMLENAWTPSVPEEEKAEICRVLDDGKPDVVLDFVCNLECAAKYLEKNGKQDTILLGYDLYPEIMPYIKNSTIDAVVYQDLSSQSYKAVQIMFEYVCYGKKPEREKYYMPLNVVFATNCEYFECGEAE